MGVSTAELTALRLAVVRLYTHGAYFQYIGPGQYGGSIWEDIQVLLKAAREAEFPPKPPQAIERP